MAGINPYGAPLDYTGAMGQASNPAESLLSGLKTGAALGELGANANAAKLAAQYQSDLEETLKQGTPQAFAALAAKYPDSATGIKSAWSTLDEGRRDQEITLGTQAYLALSQGQPDIARSIIDEQIAALENSGQQAGRLRTMRIALDSNPDQVKTSLALVLSSIDPQRWSKLTATEIEKAEADKTTAVSNATKAAVEAKYAETKAAQEAAQAGFNIQKLQQDIRLSQLNQQLAVSQENRARAKSVDDQRLADLQVKKLGQELDAKTREVVNEATDAAGSTDIVLSAINDTLRMMVETDEAGNVILDDKGKPTFLPDFDDATGPTQEAIPKWMRSQEVANIQEQFDSLGNQLTFANIGKLKGILTNSDMVALGKSMGNTSLRQDKNLLFERMLTIKTLMKKARAQVDKRYGTPSVMPNAQVPQAQPKGDPSEADVSGAMSRNLPGS